MVKDIYRGCEALALGGTSHDKKEERKASRGIEDASSFRGGREGGEVSRVLTLKKN